MLYTKDQVPEQRDIILIDFDPQVGMEIKKRRPAVVLTSSKFQQLTSFAVIAPITSTERNFPLHVKLQDCCNTHGEILCEQFRSVDFMNRDWKKVDVLPWNEFLMVQQRIAAILNI